MYYFVIYNLRMYIVPIMYFLLEGKMYWKKPNHDDQNHIRENIRIFLKL